MKKPDNKDILLKCKYCPQYLSYYKLSIKRHLVKYHKINTNFNENIIRVNSNKSLAEHKAEKCGTHSRSSAPSIPSSSNSLNEVINNGFPHSNEEELLYGRSGVGKNNDFDPSSCDKDFDSTISASHVNEDLNDYTNGNNPIDFHANKTNSKLRTEKNFHSNSQGRRTVNQISSSSSLVPLLTSYLDEDEIISNKKNCTDSYLNENELSKHFGVKSCKQCLFSSSSPVHFLNHLKECHSLKEKTTARSTKLSKHLDNFSAPKSTAHTIKNRVSNNKTRLGESYTSKMFDKDASACDAASRACQKPSIESHILNFCHTNSKEDVSTSQTHIPIDDNHSSNLNNLISFINNANQGNSCSTHSHNFTSQISSTLFNNFQNNSVNNYTSNNKQCLLSRLNSEENVEKSAVNDYDRFQNHFLSMLYKSMLILPNHHHHNPGHSHPNQNLGQKQFESISNSNYASSPLMRGNFPFPLATSTFDKVVHSINDDNFSISQSNSCISSSPNITNSSDFPAAYNKGMENLFQPYNCKDCSDHFASAIELIKHFKNKHSLKKCSFYKDSNLNHHHHSHHTNSEDLCLHSSIPFGKNNNNPEEKVGRRTLRFKCAKYNKSKYFQTNSSNVSPDDNFRGSRTNS